MSNEFTKESLSQCKPMFSAIEPKFTLGIAEVLAFGAEKYSRDNWKKCSQEQLYLYWDALERHLNAHKRGEENDSETCLSHLSHAACNLMFIQYFEDNKVNGRNKTGANNDDL
jgi:hypothetical protein